MITIINRRGLKNILALTFYIPFIFSSVSIAQTPSKINCLMPYEINLSKSNKEGVEFKYVEYQNHDDYTFWYKVNLVDNLKFSYEITSKDNFDNFDVYFYQYDGITFCRAFIQNNLDLISFQKNFEHKGLKGSTYYIGIYPLFPGGCGHKIMFKIDEGLIKLDSRNMGKSCEGTENIANQDLSLDDFEVVISGAVVDNNTGNKINARITLYDPFTHHKQALFSNDVDGYKVGLLKNGDYKVKIEAFGYEDKVTALSAYNGDVFNFKMQSSSQKNYVLQNVYFYPNTYALKDESLEELEIIYSYLINHPELQIDIVGHTNGSKNIKASRFVKNKSEEWIFNGTAKELSLRRAATIKSFMVNKGIRSYLMNDIGKGGEEMIVVEPINMTEAMLNIRVEIKITSYN